MPSVSDDDGVMQLRTAIMDFSYPKYRMQILPYLIACLAWMKSCIYFIRLSESPERTNTHAANSGTAHKAAQEFE
jgi:hypothetical protein